MEGAPLLEPKASVPPPAREKALLRHASRLVSRPMGACPGQDPVCSQRRDQTAVRHGFG